MKFLTRTIIALVIFNPAIAGLALAQFASGPIAFVITGNTGVGGVVMKGLPSDPVSDARGNYSVKVNYGWSGTVTPMKEGYAFEPASKTYSKVTDDFGNQDYNAKVMKFLISGSTGAAGVSMMGLPGDPVSGSSGDYSVTVEYGWSGTVTPTKEGYTFEPASKMYAEVNTDRYKQDYTPKALTYTISGNAGVRGAMMQGLPGNIVTDQRGYYTARLPYGWSGVVKPVKSGYIFRPSALRFSKIMADCTGEDFAPVQESSNVEGADPYATFGGSRSRGRGTGYQPTIRSGGRKALIIPASQVKAKELAETVEDMHVMSHILDERFKEKRRIQGMFTDFGAFFGRDSRGTEATYLQGFGILFLMEVNFAFSPPPKRQAQDPTETTEAGDSTWQKARQQVLSPGASPGMDDEDSAHDYDNHMVEELKKELVEALKHASNIRNIEPDEWVILTVIGGQRQFSMGFGSGIPMGGGMSGFRSSSRSGGSSGAAGGMGGGYGGGGGGGFVVGGYGGVGGMMGSGMSGGMGGMYGGMATYGGTTFSSSTVLTIRAKKSRVDDFAKGELDFEQFQEHVQIFMY
ncbi:MAG: hypothetical protein ISS70_25115 [Phycisphaerae bacterium]|nr:hypothetical protein [Phycisphaerae bacterium]